MSYFFCVDRSFMQGIDSFVAWIWYTYSRLSVLSWWGLPHGSYFQVTGPQCKPPRKAVKLNHLLTHSMQHKSHSGVIWLPWHLKSQVTWLLVQQLVTNKTSSSALLCNVQNLVVIWYSRMKIQKNRISLEFELKWKKWFVDGYLL